MRVHASTVASEDATFRTADPSIAGFATGVMKPKATVLGAQLAGAIEAIGNDVKRFKAGDQILETRVLVLALMLRQQEKFGS